MSDAHNDESGAPPVTICCAASDGASVRETASALIARGHQVELAVGVDVDQAVLTRAIAALRGRGLYVLCRSHALDRNAVDELREVLRAHDVPFGRTLTLAVDTQRPREVEERIVSVLRRMVTGRADERPRAWGTGPSTTVPTHDEDPDTTVRRPGGAAGDPAGVLVALGSEPEGSDPYARTSQIEMPYERGTDIVPPPYTGADHTAVGPAPQGPAGAGLPSSVPRPAPMVATPSPPPTPLAAVAMPSAPAPVGEALSPSSMPAAPMPLLSPGMSMGAASPVVSDSLTAYTPPPVTADEPSTDFDEPLTTGSPMGRALGSPVGLAVAIGGLLVVGLIVAGTFVLGDDGDGGTQASAPSTASADLASKDAEPKADAKADVAKDGDPKATDPKGEDPKGEDPKADDAKAVEEPEAPSEPEPAPEPEPTSDLDPSTPGSRPRWAAAADPGDALPARTFAPEDDPPEVVAALRSREVRAIDVFLVAPERKGTLTFDQATSYCKELEVAGLTGWRVPAIGELNAVASAKMLSKAIFWSMTPGDSFGDLRLVVGTKKATTIVAVPKSWDGAKIVCIRPRQP